MTHIPSQLLQHAPLAALFALLLLGGIGLPFPEDATLMLSGLLISHDVLRAVPALITVYAGVLIADVLLFQIGRRYGRGIVTHRRFRRLLPPDRLSRLEVRFQRNGFLFVLLGRHLAGFRAQIFLAAGVLRMPFAVFLLADALSALASVGVMVGIGYAGGNSLDELRKDVTRIEHLAVVTIAAAVLVLLMRRYFRRGAPKDG
jgi:membrane protein DedA with SNARE-associated domain